MPNYNEIDTAIMEVREGTHNSFGTVIQTYHVQIRAMIGAQIIDQHNADDIAQQVFIFAFQNIEKYTLGTNCLAWLKAIARNMILTHIRKSSQFNKNLQSYRKQDILCKSTELIDADAFEGRLVALGSCIDELPSEQRDFLLKVNGRDSTLEKLAESLGRSGASVRKQASRLYCILRTCIQNKLKVEGGS